MKKKRTAGKKLTLSRETVIQLDETLRNAAAATGDSLCIKCVSGLTCVTCQTFGTVCCNTQGQECF